MKLPRLTAGNAALIGYAVGSAAVSAGAWVLLGFGAALVTFGAFTLYLSFLIARGIANHG